MKSSYEKVLAAWEILVAWHLGNMPGDPTAATMAVLYFGGQQEKILRDHGWTLPEFEAEVKRRSLRK